MSAFLRLSFLLMLNGSANGVKPLIRRMSTGLNAAVAALDQQDVATLISKTAETATLEATQSLHVVYQVACSAYSLHQAIALDWSWHHVKQPGKLTRIVCGCESAEGEKHLKASVLEGHPDFAVFFAKDWNQEVPKDFPQVHDDMYHAYNHPFGFKEWFEHSTPQEEYILYMEPDMIFLKPIVSHGAALGMPVGQHYEYVHAKSPDHFDPGWEEFLIPEVCGIDCPSSTDIDPNSFAVGPPTVLHKSDWAKLVPLWGKYSVEVRARGHMGQGAKGSWQKEAARTYIAEMLAYSLAAAVAKLPHRSIEVVADAYHPAPAETKIAHFCYSMASIGPDSQMWYWNKYRPPFGYGTKGPDQWLTMLLLDCEMPLFVEPPEESWRNRGDTYRLIQKSIRTYNQAFLSFKEQRCQPQKLEKHKLILLDEDIWYVLNSSIPEGDHHLRQLLEGTPFLKNGRTKPPRK